METEMGGVGWSRCTRRPASGEGCGGHAPPLPPVPRGLAGRQGQRAGEWGGGSRLTQEGGPGSQESVGFSDDPLVGMVRGSVAREACWRGGSGSDQRGRGLGVGGICWGGGDGREGGREAAACCHTKASDQRPYPSVGHRPAGVIGITPTTRKRDPTHDTQHPPSMIPLVRPWDQRVKPRVNEQNGVFCAPGGGPKF